MKSSERLPVNGWKYGKYLFPCMQNTSFLLFRQLSLKIFVNLWKDKTCWKAVKTFCWQTDAAAQRLWQNSELIAAHSFVHNFLCFIYYWWIKYVRVQCLSRNWVFSPVTLLVSLMEHGRDDCLYSQPSWDQVSVGLDPFRGLSDSLVPASQLGDKTA